MVINKSGVAEIRVLVEFFDKEPIKNVMGTCIFEPELVVFLCDKRDLKLVKESAVYRLLRHRKLRTRPRFYYMDASRPEEIVRVMQAVVRDYPGCVFDFSGGRDLALLTAGAYCETHEIRAYYIDYDNQRFIDLRGCKGLESQFAMPVFSAEDIFVLTGATIHGYGHFEAKELTPEFERDVLQVWEIVKTNTKAWGNFVAWLQAVCSKTSPLALEMECPLYLNSEPHGVKANPLILENLQQAGILKQCRIKKESVLLEFKSLLHKKSLMNQGIWLELYCYTMAKQSGFFDDVRTSLVIDWDGVEGGPDTTKNEVDVFLVKGVVPVFVSCKMSVPIPLALSEIKVLSVKFGGSQSKAVLVTAGVLGPEHKALQIRAADLGVTLIDFTAIKKEEMKQELIAVLAEEK